jgi:hypothetical protein
MRLLWEKGSSELSNGRGSSGRVVTLEIWRFSVSIWLTKEER